jgi:hypothetical protein
MADCFEQGTERELRSSGMMRSLALSKGCATPQKSAVISYSLLQPEITRSAAAAVVVQLEGILVCQSLSCMEGVSWLVS